MSLRLMWKTMKGDVKKSGVRARMKGDVKKSGVRARQEITKIKARIQAETINTLLDEKLSCVMGDEGEYVVSVIEDYRDQLTETDKGES